MFLQQLRLRRKWHCGTACCFAGPTRRVHEHGSWYFKASFGFLQHVSISAYADSTLNHKTFITYISRTATCHHLSGELCGTVKPMNQIHCVLCIASQGIVARRAFRGNSAFCILKQVLQCSGVTFLSTSEDYISDCIIRHL